MKIEDLRVPIPQSSQNATIFVKRFYSTEKSIPVLALHGSIENGRIFYNEKGTRGIAPFLAANNFDVYVPDLRGKGRSEPQISRDSDFGNREAILEDLGAAFGLIKETKPDSKIQCIAHSWGGVLLSSYFARFNNPDNIGKAVYFGTRRKLSIWSLERLLKIELGWNLYGKYLIKKHGYFPYKDLGYKGENESRGSFYETNHWLKSNWIDERDQFDYSTAFSSSNMPETLWLIGEGDKLLGNKKDMLATMSEIGNPADQSMLLGKSEGLSRNYGHNDMLTHAAAKEEVYPKVLKWLKSNSE